MKTRFYMLVAAGLLAAVFASTAALREVPAASFPVASTNAPAASFAMARAKTDQPGEDLARTVSQLTGVAISPLLGTGAIGAYRYFDTPAGQRGELPWFAQPWFWVPALLLVTLAAAKDTLGPVTPSALKKPMDVVEVLENKVSGLIAAGAFVPLAVGVFGSSLPGTTGLGLDAAGAGLAAATQSQFLNILLTPFAVLAFIAVWLLGHVIHALILISPFTMVDTALKALRTALLASVVGTSFANPWFGAVWSMVIIIVASVLAGWSFRLNWLAAVFLFDILSRRRRWFRPDPVENRLFLARQVDEAPSRSYGRLSRDEEGNLHFKYRPFLVGKEREVTLPEGDYCVGRGFVYADLLKLEGADSRRLGILPPRYKNHEDEITRLYQFAPPQDVGLRAVWGAIRELLGFGPAPVSARAAG